MISSDRMIMSVQSSQMKTMLSSLGCFRRLNAFPRLIACEAQTHFRSSLLYLRKIASANPSSKTISMTWTFCFDVDQSDQRIEYSSRAPSRPRALACLGFWRELPNTLWNVNFTTITRFPATLNDDFFMKQRLLKLCMWYGPFNFAS